jgi:AAA domain
MMVGWDRYRGGGDPPYDDDAPANVTRLPLQAAPARRLAPSDIPPRPWLYGTILLRRYATMLIAPGGTGKSQLALGISLDLATGRRLLGFHIFERTPVWYLNLEDDPDELDRRIAAFRMAHNISWDEIEGYLFAHSGRQRPVCMAKVGEDGSTVIFPDRDEIIAGARANRIGAIWVDPFVKSHELDENSNPQMDAAVAAWNQVAEEAGCAIGLVHHVRKGAATGIEAARGAKAMTDAARVGLLLTAMTTEEAGEIGVAKEDASRFLRLDNAKANMSAAGVAMWFEMVERNLGNATKLYPAGDTVSALVRWRRPSAWDALDGYTLALIFAKLRDGPGEGEQFCLTKRGREAPRWAGSVLMQMASVTDGQAQSVLGEWVHNGVLMAGEYVSKQQRKTRTGIVLNEAKITDIIANYQRNAVDDP